MKKVARKPVPDEILNQVLVESKRRCCLCFGLDSDLRQKSGQIAHMDHDRSNNDKENLAYLCLPHHDDYDARKGQSRGFTIGELKRYRADLYDYLRGITVSTLQVEPDSALGGQDNGHQLFTLGKDVALSALASSSPPETATEVPNTEKDLFLSKGYVLVKKLGEGSSGDVYRAVQVSLDRTVAIKVLPEDSATLKESIDRFVREAKAMARCNHPNIAHIFDIQSGSNRPFICMEYVDGRSLRQSLEELGSTRDRLLFLKELALALEFAHDHGIIHRDVSPNNVLVTKDRMPKLIDFGWTKLVDGKPITSTNEGGFGTLNYVSPEQRRSSKNVDKLTDIYSFGCVLHFTMTGDDPVLGARFGGIDPRCRQMISDLYNRCIDDKPRNRPQNMREIVVALDEILRKVSDPPSISHVGSTRIPVSMSGSLKVRPEKVLSEDQARQLLRESKDFGDGLYCFLAIMANTGLMLSEIIHLRWSDIRHDSIIFTRRKLAQLRREEIAVSPLLAEMLRGKIGTSKKDDYLFPGDAQPCELKRSNGTVEQLCQGRHTAIRTIQTQWEGCLRQLGLLRRGRGIDSLRKFALSKRISPDSPDNLLSIL